MDLTSLVMLPARAKLIANLWCRTNTKISQISPEIIKAIILNADGDAAQVSLLNRYQNELSSDEVREILRLLPKPYSDIEPGYKRPSVDNTPENRELVAWLERRSVISSSSKAILSDSINIYNYRK